MSESSGAGAPAPHQSGPLELPPGTEAAHGPATERGRRMAGAVYGSLLAASVIAAWHGGPPTRLAVTILGTGIVFTVAHAYAIWIAELSESGPTRRRPGLKHAALDEWPLAQASVAPALVVLVVGAAAGLQQAERLGLLACLAQQVLWSLGIVRRHARSKATAALAVLGNLVLVLVLVALKAEVH